VQPNIRRAEPLDAEALLSLICEHAQFEKEPFDPTNKLDGLRAALGTKNAPFSCLVVENENGIQGYCSYMPQFDSWYCEFYMFVDALYLRESLRGASIGSELMARVLAEGKAANCTSLRVMTPAENKRASNFYTKIGGSSTLKLWFTIQ
jgi:GNAT superfamily N-acetyltransferase